MNPFVKQMIKEQLHYLTPAKLQSFAMMNHIHLTTTQAQKIVAIIKEEKVDLNNKNEVYKLIQRLQYEVDEDVATIIEQLLQQYGHYL